MFYYDKEMKQHTCKIEKSLTSPTWLNQEKVEHYKGKTENAVKDTIGQRYFQYVSLFIHYIYTYGQQE